MAITNKNLIYRPLERKMLACIEEYEAIKSGTNTRFKTVKDFCEYHKFSRQSFRLTTDINKIQIITAKHQDTK